MTRDVQVCGPQESIRACSRAMALNDIGVIPVAENNLLIGMVTDRDIAIQDVGHVAESMGTAKIRRVAVLTRKNQLVGILSLGDVAVREPDIAGSAVAELSNHGGPHSQQMTTPAAA